MDICGVILVVALILSFGTILIYVAHSFIAISKLYCWLFAETKNICLTDCCFFDNVTI